MSGHLPRGNMGFSTSNLEESLASGYGWINDLFDDYRLFPVIGDDEKTKRILTSESIVKSVVEVILRRANLSAFVNSLTGTELLAQSKEGNLIQEAYLKIDESLKLKKTINDRIRKVTLEVANAELFFSCVKEEFGFMKSVYTGGRLFRKSLFEKIDFVDRKFVCVHGVLCRIDRAQTVCGATIAKSLSGSQIAWVLTDYPYFVMGQPKFHNGVVLLDMNPAVVARLEGALPFWSEVGWFPYVRVSGECRYPYSQKYGYPAITPSWIEYRIPKNPEDVRKTLNDAYNGTSRYSVGARSVVKENPLEVLTYLDVIKIVAKGANLDVSDLRWITQTFHDATASSTKMKKSLFNS